MSSPDNRSDFVVFEQEIVVCDVGNDIAGEDILPPAIRRADSTGRGVEDFGDFLHHVVDYAGGHGFGGSGSGIQWVISSAGQNSSVESKYHLIRFLL